MPFPVLRTPFVVLSEIISVLEPREIVTASFCSIKMERLLRSHYQQRKPLEWKLFMLDYDSYGCVEIAKSKMNIRTAVMMTRHIAELGVAHRSDKLRFSPECSILYTKDRVFGTKLIVDYVTDLFDLDVYGLVIDRTCTWAIDWINTRQEKMLGGMGLSANLKHNWYADATVDYVLRKVCATKCLSIRDNVSDHFRFDGKLGPAEHLVIQPYGHWVTINNLMNYDFNNILITGSSLSVSDFNSFLRHWRAGGSPRLAFLEVYFENDLTIFDNFDEDLEIVETNEVRRYRVVADEDREFEIQGGYSIQRTDGVKATINCDIRMFTMVVWHADRN
ncbi:Protein CBG13925 [Caenorhabditis briggsae]|uniref:Protein CBG13925 n=2 Tax=Caenorhabditis briggsae TaxID=6238 RepID=A8XJ09_CAEBR|nr:Protein CBG13925 [Caenorhabditis briggsae]ULT97794.1 hypothetical protein L3Y34_005552 [Caenorhabditis briggsae]CAP32636.1 Protein CBG13925 [Caenorhabditis briggsae]